MICILGSDHAGLSLAKYIMKQLIESKNINKLIDFLPPFESKVDYPDFAKLVCKEVLNNANSFGILICGSGIGMSICANRYKGIRAALCFNEYMARCARSHNDANILCLGERIIGHELAYSIVGEFLATKFDGIRHQVRINKIEND